MLEFALPNAHALAVMILIVVALVLFARDNIPLETTSLVVIVLLAVGCLALSLLALTGLKNPILVGPAAEVLMKGTKVW